MTKNITLTACGKLNLFLDIVGRREDGYHLLETVMQSVSVKDKLCFELEDGEGIEIKCELPGFPTDESNLICKAVRRFTEETGERLPGRLVVTVEKNIPTMAGMGGGSADCAAALAAMNELTGAGLTGEELIKIGETLGADVPFTLVGGTALCEGTGEKITPIEAPQGVWYAAVQPELRVSTGEAYAACDRSELSHRYSCAEFAGALIAGDVRAAAGKMYNCFEEALGLREVEEIKEKMLAQGALGAMLTGSGSVVYGIFDEEEKAKRCIEGMKGMGFASVLTPTKQGIETVK